MGLAQKSVLTSVFIGTATAAQAALSLITVDFIVTDNDSQPEINVGSTGSLSFVIDDAIGSVFDNPFYEFDGAITQILNSNIDTLTFSDPDVLVGNITTLDNFDLNGTDVDGTSLRVGSTTLTSDPNLTIDDVTISLAADDTLWTIPDTISGSVISNFNSLVTSGNAINTVIWTFERSGSSVSFDVHANITGGSLSAIPEPSAYGALAGTLALAGAAATRRRRATVDALPSPTND